MAVGQEVSNFIRASGLALKSSLLSRQLPQNLSASMLPDAGQKGQVHSKNLDIKLCI